MKKVIHFCWDFKKIDDDIKIRFVFGVLWSLRENYMPRYYTDQYLLVILKQGLV